MMIFILGILFGAILMFAKLNKFNTIGGLATLEDFTVAKALLLAVGIGAILLSAVVGLGFATFHVKPLLLGGIIVGGIVFGAGMAILGYCPGTLAISLGEGSLDAFAGIVGGLLGGLTFTLLLPALEPFLGPDFGKLSLYTLVGSSTWFYFLTIVIGFIFIGISFWLHKLGKANSKNWLYSGIALALLNVAITSNLVSGSPIGASTAYPYLADLSTGLTQNEYFSEIKKSGNWQIIFLGGAFFAGLIFSLLKKDFNLTFTHSLWIKYKGDSKAKRIVWSLFGGFIMIFGARMAGGCTSGHILSGGMQIAFSSLIFGVFTFAGLLVTGHLFYKRG